MKKNSMTDKRPNGVVKIRKVDFVPYPVDLMLDRELTFGARQLYVIYRSKASNKTFQAALANAKAAECLGVSRGTIIRWKAELEEEGWISIKERGEQGLPDIITVYDNKAI